MSNHHDLRADGWKIQAVAGAVLVAVLIVLIVALSRAQDSSFGSGDASRKFASHVLALGYSCRGTGRTLDQCQDDLRKIFDGESKK